MSTTFKILRFDPPKDEHPHFQEYIHTPKPGDTMLEVLKEIRDEQDPSISFRYSCREAVCGSCALTINGTICLACKRQFEALKTDVVVIEPLPNLEIIKDLIVDFKPFWDAYNFIQPYLQPEGQAVPEKGHCVEEKDMEKVFQFITCTSAPPPWPSSTASPSIRATSAPGRRWPVSTIRPASGVAIRSSAVTTSVPKTSGRPTASKASAER
jgi:succinate dehydrogenase / fumarate reductase iron-sulfur subunit